MDIKRNDRLIASASSHHLDIVDSGYACVSTDWNLQHVRSPYTRLYVIYGGEGTLHHQHQDIVLQPGYVYLIPAQMVFDYACGNFMDQLFFHLNLYAADGKDLLTRLNRIDALPISTQDRETLREAYWGDSLSDAIRMQQRIHALLADFITASTLGNQKIEAPSAFLQQVYTLARQNCDARTTVKGLAEKLAVSPSTLSKRFKLETGTTLGHYLDGLLLQKAQQQLLSTDDAIGRISEQLGFCDQFYFSRYFKQRWQETPSRYRQRLRNRL